MLQGCALWAPQSSRNDYGAYPDIALLPQSDARPVVIKKDLQLPFPLTRGDLDEVVAIISRIPDSVISHAQREVVCVWSGVPFQTVAVQVQLGYNTMLVFVKPTAKEWNLVGVYHYDT